MKAKQVKKSKVRQFIEYSLMGTVYPAVSIPAFYDEIRIARLPAHSIDMFGFWRCHFIVLCRGFRSQKTQPNKNQVEECSKWKDKMRTEAEDL